MHWNNNMIPRILRAAGAGLITVLIAVLVLASNKNNEAAQAAGSEETETAQNTYDVNTNEEIRELIRSYYDAYAVGDTAALEQIVKPLSDEEKGFVAMFSEYVDEYENLTCYQKQVPGENSYMVNAAVDILFSGVDTPAPGLDFFYVETNEDGSLYINNLYCQFNSMMEVDPVNPKTQSMIEDYEEQMDVVLLKESVQKRYESAVMADPALGELISSTIRDAYTSWATEPDETEGIVTAAVETEAIESEAPEPETETEPVTETETETETEEETETETETEKETEAVKETEEKETEGPAAITFSPGEKIMIKSAVSVRMEMSENAKKVGAAHEGDTVKVIQSYAEGWTKVEWKGKTGYIRSDLL